MKTAALPAVHVEPEILHALESVLTDAETVGVFVEASARASVQRRRVEADFIACELHSRDEARGSGRSVDADTVCEGLQRQLNAARAPICRIAEVDRLADSPPQAAYPSTDNALSASRPQ